MPTQEKIELSVTDIQTKTVGQLMILLGDLVSEVCEKHSDVRQFNMIRSGLGFIRVQPPQDDVVNHGVVLFRFTYPKKSLSAKEWFSLLNNLIKSCGSEPCGTGS